MHSPQDAIAAIATPLGEGGLGVVRVSGPSAVSIVQSVFRSPKGVDLSQAPSHTCHFGTLAEEESIDQVVVSVFRGPHSYTGEDVVEISAHGSPFVLQKILNLCLRQGARLAGPGEFTQRAFLSGKMDLTQAEAVAELIRAKTDKSHAAALAQLEGRLARKVRALRDTLLPLLAHLEVGLDHSDEDHDFLSREKLVEGCAVVQRQVDELLQSAKVGKILREGLRVALAGRPNVGKSSLLNALLKEERAIVTPIPGTTRDTLEESVNWDGIPVVLTDTAGLRQETQDPIERLGMKRTQKALAQADVALAIFDGSEPLTEEDRQVAEACQNRPHVWVVNKTDLPAPSLDVIPRGRQRGTHHDGSRLTLPPVRPRRRAILPKEQGRMATCRDDGCIALEEAVNDVVRVSAKTGEGLSDLMEAVKRLALTEKAFAGEAQWLLNTRHQAALERAKEALVHAVRAAQADAYEECVALELQTALSALGEIIGETTTEELLDQIFSQFCIGK